MANIFKPGMTNFVEVLNQMWAAFVVGPYNALSLAGGTMTGPLASISTIGAEGEVTSRHRLLSPKLHVGVVGADPDISVIARIGSIEGAEVLALANVGSFFHGDGGLGNGLPTCLNISRNGPTGRGVTSKGTFNGNGADYAEYLIKGLLCGTIVPGQIIGIDAEGRLTDKWDLAISFAVKSTNPCMVGGDTWAAHLGPRPIAPVRQDGDTDEQWADALAAAQVGQQIFDAELEQARRQVDRIAFAGQVPVNLQGAEPGQFIVPVQDGDGIAGVAIDEADITLRQYMRALGRVIAIEDDGRARIIVKVA